MNNTEMGLTTLTPITEKVLELKISGQSNSEISKALGIPTYHITQLLAKDDVKQLLNDMITTTTNAIVAQNVEVLNGIITAKLAKLAADGKGLEEATGKDVVDLLTIINNLSTSKEKLEKDTTQNNYIQVLQGFMK